MWPVFQFGQWLDRTPKDSYQCNPINYWKQGKFTTDQDSHMPTLSKSLQDQKRQDQSLLGCPLEHEFWLQTLWSKVWRLCHFKKTPRSKALDQANMPTL